MELSKFATLYRDSTLCSQDFLVLIRATTNRLVPKETNVSKCKRIINQSLSLPWRPLIATLAGSVVATGIIAGTTLTKDCIGRTHLYKDVRCCNSIISERVRETRGQLESLRLSGKRRKITKLNIGEFTSLHLIFITK